MFRNMFKPRDATEALPAPTARRARAAGEQGHKRFTRSCTLAVLMLWSLLLCCSSSCSRPRRPCTLAALMLGLLLPLLRCCSSWCWRSCSCPSCCSRCSCVACSACTALTSRASRSMIGRFGQMACRRDASAFGAKTRPPFWASSREAAGEVFWSYF